LEAVPAPGNHFEAMPAFDDLAEVKATYWGAAVTSWDVFEVVALPGNLFRGRGEHIQYP
jgi:hypothetical protein